MMEAQLRTVSGMQRLRLRNFGDLAIEVVRSRYIDLD